MTLYSKVRQRFAASLLHVFPSPLSYVTPLLHDFEQLFWSNGLDMRQGGTIPDVITMDRLIQLIQSIGRWCRMDGWFKIVSLVQQ